MKIALIQCPQWQRDYPPLGIAMLSATLRREGHTVNVFDINNDIYHKANERYKNMWGTAKTTSWTQRDFVLEFIAENRKEIKEYVEKIIASRAKAIGFSVQFCSLLMSFELAKMIKERDRNKFIIFGGPECCRGRAGYQLIKDDNIDALVIGEGEVTLLELIEIIDKTGKIDFCRGVIFKKNEKIVDCGARPEIEDLNTLPFPNFRDFSLDSYKISDKLPICSSRGCPMKCAFCNVRTIWRRYRSLKAERLFQEMKEQLKIHKNVKSFYFCESIRNGNMKEYPIFYDFVIKEKRRNKRFLNVTWGEEVLVRKEITKGLLKKMKLAGCSYLIYGLETGSQKVLKDMGKKFSINLAEEVIRNTHKVGICTAANFLIGFPTEEKRDFKETLNFLKRNYKYLDTVGTSETCCSIDEGSILYNNSKKYFVSHIQHHIYWESDNGKNSYPTRVKRLNKFCKTIRTLRMSMSGGGLTWTTYRWFNLAKYYEYKKDFNKAKYYYRKFKNFQKKNDKSIRKH